MLVHLCCFACSVSWVFLV